MNLKIVFGLLCMSFVKGQDICDPFSKGCNVETYQAKISCSGEEACTCADGDNPEAQENCPTGFDDMDLHIADLTTEKCKELCETVGDSTKCKYYRWEQDTVPEDHTQCFLLKDCSEYLACSADTEGQHHCESGQIECTDSPAPGGTDCNQIPAANFLNEPGAVHWTCLDPHNLDDTVIIYGSGSVKPGTICWTAQGCKKFDTTAEDGGAADEKGEMDYHKLVVQCNDETLETAVTGGQWVKYTKADNDIEYAITEVADENMLVDQTCRPADLVLTASDLNQVGVAFICDLVDDAHYETDDTHITLKEYNTCFLLCNFHHVMTIHPKFGEDPQWFRYLPDGDEIDEARAENVKCW